MRYDRVRSAASLCRFVPADQFQLGTVIPAGSLRTLLTLIPGPNFQFREHYNFSFSALSISRC